MINDDSKFLLRARRPSGADDQDPAMARALAAAQADPALAAWAARERTLDAAIAGKLRGVTPPAELRQMILAGGRLSRPRAWLRPGWMGLAATVTLGAGLWFAGVRPAADAHTLLVEAALEDLGSSGHLLGATTHAEDVGELGTWLETEGNRLTQSPPVDLAALRAQHCRTLSVGGREMFEVCFRRGNFFHVYVGRREDFPALHDIRTPQIRTVRGLAFATWSDARHVYLVAATGDDVDGLRQVL